MAKTEPKCKECLCSASVGGKIQIVKFDVSADFHYSISRTYDIPEDWNERDVTDFQVDKESELRGILEPIADAEVQELFAQKEELSS